MDARVSGFPVEVRKCFGFLVDEFGFDEVGRTAEGMAGYASPPLWIWVMLEERNNTVDTNVTYHDGLIEVTVPVGELMAPAGIRGFNPSPGSAQTRRAMATSMTRQAAVLREVLPQLRSDGAHALIAQAGPGWL